MSSLSFSVPVVHAVTDDEIVLRRDFLELARRVMEALGPRGALHLRARRPGARRLLELAGWLAAWERDTGCWAIINDRVDLACAAGLRAVQLTARSFTPRDARAVNAGLRVGVSVHSAADARSAESLGADWCIAGPAFPTSTHPGQPAAGIGLIQETAAAVTLPLIAIGGVTPERIAALRDAGAYGIAAISGVWQGSSDDVAAAALRYLSSYDEYEGAD